MHTDGAPRGFTLIELVIVVSIIAVLAAIAIPSLMKSRITANETSAMATLRTLFSIQATWKQGDVDGNGFSDYWTGDVSGFYRAADGSGGPVKMVGMDVAKADLAPLPAGAAPRPYLTPELSASGAPVSKNGYFYQAMTTDENGDPYQDGSYSRVNGAVAGFHMLRFGFVACPETYNNTGVNLYIGNERGVIYSFNAGSGSPILAWPGPDPTRIDPPNGPWRSIQ